MSVTRFYRNIINEAIEQTQFDADGIAKVKAALEAAAKRLETITLDKGGQCYTLEFDGAKVGAKYLKVWKNTKWGGKRNETGRSIWAFVGPNGLLWKPVSKNPRFGGFLLYNGNMKKHLIIIRGTPGSGKSTMAAKLIDNDIAKVVLEADDYFSNGGAYRFDASKLGEAHAECQSKVRHFLGLGLETIVSNTSTTWKEMRPYLDIARAMGAHVTIITMKTQFQNIHGVPDEKVEIMRNRMIDREHFMGTYKQVYGSPFTGDYIEYGKDDLCHTMQVLQSRTSSPEKLNT